jgi:polar amino acid transport system permease protein
VFDYSLNFTLVWRHFDRLYAGLWLGIELAFVSILIGIIIGLTLALAWTGGNKATRVAVGFYVETIRNTPLLLLIYIIYYGLPSAGGVTFDQTTSFIITLSLYAGAYLVEVFRAGLDAVPAGLIDAGKSIGLTPLQLLLSVRLPTMFRIVLPALGNAFISLFKDTSLASVIAVPELTYGAQYINFSTFRIVEVYMIVAPMYLVTGYAITFVLQRLERRFAVARS